MNIKKVIPYAFSFAIMFSCGAEEPKDEEASNESTDKTVVEEPILEEPDPVAEKNAFLSSYDAIIDNRDDMKSILKSMAFISNDQEDPNTKLHYIQRDAAEGSFYYDPCEDNSGFSRFLTKGSNETTGVMEEDQPSFFFSYQDSYGWKMTYFEKQENGVKFNLEGDDEGTERSLEVTKAGYWVYHLRFNKDHIEDQYMVTHANLRLIEEVKGDCEF